MTNQPREYDLEAVYDEHVSPLMTEIIARCKKYGIPLFASFQLTTDGAREDETELFCTTAIHTDWQHERMGRHRKIAYPDHPIVALSIYSDRLSDDDADYEW